MKLKNTFKLAKHYGTEKKPYQNESSGLCWKQENLIVPLITVLHCVTLKCKISINGTFHISQGILQIFSRFCDLSTLYLQKEASAGHSPVDWHLQPLKAIFTTTTLFTYLFQISEWFHRDSRAEEIRNNMTKQLRKCCPLVVTPSLSLLDGKGLDTSPCFHPAFSGKSSRLPSLLRVSLLSDSHTDFALPPWCSGYIAEVCVKHKES